MGNLHPRANYRRVRQTESEKFIIENPTTWVEIDPNIDSIINPYQIYRLKKNVILNDHILHKGLIFSFIDLYIRTENFAKLKIGIIYFQTPFVKRIVILKEFKTKSHIARYIKNLLHARGDLSLTKQYFSWININEKSYFVTNPNWFEKINHTVLFYPTYLEENKNEEESYPTLIIETKSTSYHQSDTSISQI